MTHTTKTTTHKNSDNHNNHKTNKRDNNSNPHTTNNNIIDGVYQDVDNDDHSVSADLWVDVFSDVYRAFASPEAFAQLDWETEHRHGMQAGDWHPKSEDDDDNESPPPLSS